MRPPPGGFRGKRKPQTVLKTDERDIASNSGVIGNLRPNQAVGTKPGLPSKATGVSKNGRWVLCHVSARPGAPKPVLHYFPDDE